MAVKTLASRDPDKVAKFMEEAELMKNFSHPNIVSLLGMLHCMNTFPKSCKQISLRFVSTLSIPYISTMER